MSSDVWNDGKTVWKVQAGEKWKRKDNNEDKV
jgi:hypothetical protein